MLSYAPELEYTLPPSAEELYDALHTGRILQAMCIKCDEFHNLHVELGEIRGFVPRSEAGIEISESPAKIFSILSRVGKAICFNVLDICDGTAILSRKSAQLSAKFSFLQNEITGKIIHATVQNPAHFGVFCDIGCGLTALMRIDRCCISRLESTSQLFKIGQDIRAAILSTDKNTGKIELTGRELLGTWEENASLFHAGQTVAGVVRSVMPYGIFIELTPNLSGLAEYQQNVSIGETVCVYIRSIQPEKHKIKLNIISKIPQHRPKNVIHYFITDGQLKKWEYYPGSSAVTVF